jgi:hypothetical protein
VLSEPAKWVAALEGHPQTCGVVAAAALLFTYFLIYTNVRDVVGRVPGAGLRALKAFGWGLAWCGAFLGAGWTFATLTPELSPLFELKTASVDTVLAYAVAVLIQFFFSPKSASIADPL